MSVCLIVVNPTQTQEQANQAIAHMRTLGPLPPEGARVLFGGPADPGWRFVSVWESQEALERFVAERLVPTYDALGMDYDAAERTVFEVHKLGAGDLTGAPQPA